MIRKKPFSFTSACEVKFKRASVIFLATIVVSVISSYQSCLALDHQIFIFKWRFKFDFKSSFRFNLELLTDTAARLLVQRLDIWRRAQSPNSNLGFCCTCESLQKCRGCGPQSAKTVMFSTALACIKLLQPQVMAGIKQDFFCRHLMWISGSSLSLNTESQMPTASPTSSRGHGGKENMR